MSLSFFFYALCFSHGSGLNAYAVLCCHAAVDLSLCTYYHFVVTNLTHNFVFGNVQVVQAVFDQTSLF